MARAAHRDHQGQDRRAHRRASAFHQQGFDVRVFESAPELREIGAGVALGPNAMKVMRSLGLEDAIRAVGWESEYGIGRHWRTGKVITQSVTPRADVVARYGASGSTLHRADLLDVLAHALPDAVEVNLASRGVSAKTDGEVAVAADARTVARSRPTSSSAPTGSTRRCGRSLRSRGAPVYRQGLLPQRHRGRLAGDGRTPRRRRGVRT